MSKGTPHSTVATSDTGSVHTSTGTSLHWHSKCMYHTHTHTHTHTHARTHAGHQGQRHSLRALLTGHQMGLQAVCTAHKVGSGGVAREEQRAVTDGFEQRIRGSFNSGTARRTLDPLHGFVRRVKPVALQVWVILMGHLQIKTPQAVVVLHWQCEAGSG
eukprot:scaffold143256_cov16-Tisochrysis_lutea.AAC.1